MLLDKNESLDSENLGQLDHLPISSKALSEETISVIKIRREIPS